MKKATQKATAPVSLGTKRACPNCGTKIYDFNRTELTCPKCDRTFTANETPAPPPITLLKRPRAAEKAEGELAAQTDVLSSEDPVEVVDDVGDLDTDEDEVVEDLAVDDESDDED